MAVDVQPSLDYLQRCSTSRPGPPALGRRQARPESWRFPRECEPVSVVCGLASIILRGDATQQLLIQRERRQALSPTRNREPNPRDLQREREAPLPARRPRERSLRAWRGEACVWPGASRGRPEPRALLCVSQPRPRPQRSQRRWPRPPRWLSVALTPPRTPRTSPGALRHEAAGGLAASPGPRAIGRVSAPAPRPPSPAAKPPARQRARPELQATSA